MMGLTAAQQRLLRFIAGYQAAHGGVSPSFAECARGMGWKSKGGVSEAICALEHRGAIRRLHNRERAIELLVPVSIPSVGSVPLYAVPMVAKAKQVFSGERV